MCVGMYLPFVLVKSKVRLGKVEDEREWDASKSDLK